MKLTLLNYLHLKIQLSFFDHVFVSLLLDDQGFATLTIHCLIYPLFFKAKYPVCAVCFF